MEKVKKFGLSLEASVFEETERRRGLVPRSTFINAALKKLFDSGGSLDEPQA